MAARVVSLAATVGLLLGTAIATAVHFTTWSSATSSNGRPRGANYLPLPPPGTAYASKLTVHWTHVGAVHPSWWPSLGVGPAVGLLAGVVLGIGLTLARPQLISDADDNADPRPI